VEALERLGKKKWAKNVYDVVARLRNALQADYVVLGGGNAKRLGELPPRTFLGDNQNAREGGFRLWLGSTSTVKGKRIQAAIYSWEKAEALKAVLEGPYRPEQLLAQLIDPHAGTSGSLPQTRAAGGGCNPALREGALKAFVTSPAEARDDQADACGTSHRMAGRAARPEDGRQWSHGCRVGGLG
jgi:hypothetical protein